MSHDPFDLTNRCTMVLASEGINDLNDSDLASVVAAMTSEIEIVVGNAVAEILPKDKFAEVADSTDETRTLAVLEEHCPDFRDIVARAIDAQLSDLGRNARAYFGGD